MGLKDREFPSLIDGLVQDAGSDRVAASAKLVEALQVEDDGELEDKKLYTVKRLISGLKSSREYAPLAFALGLREVLAKVEQPPSLNLEEMYDDQIGYLDGRIAHKHAHAHDGEVLHNVKAFCAYTTILVATSKLDLALYTKEWNKLSENYNVMTNSGKLATSWAHFNVITSISEKKYRKYFKESLVSFLRNKEPYNISLLTALEVTLVQALFPSVYLEIVPEGSDFREMWSDKVLYLNTLALVDAFFPFIHPMFDALTLLITPGDERIFQMTTSLANQGRLLCTKCCLVLLAKFLEDKAWTKYIGEFFTEPVVVMISSITPLDKAGSLLAAVHESLSRMKLTRLVKFFRTCINQVEDPSSLFGPAGLLNGVAAKLDSSKKTKLLGAFLEEDIASMKSSHKLLVMLNRILSDAKSGGKETDVALALSDASFKFVSSCLNTESRRERETLVSTPMKMLLENPKKFIEYFSAFVRTPQFEKVHPKVASLCGEISGSFDYEPFGKTLVALSLKLCLESHDIEAVRNLTIACKDLVRCQKGFIDEEDEPGSDDHPRWQRVAIDAILSLVTIPGASLKDFYFPDFKLIVGFLSDDDVAFMMKASESSEESLDDEDEDGVELEEDDTGADSESEADDEDDDEDSDDGGEDEEKPVSTQLSSELKELQEHVVPDSGDELVDLDNASPEALENFDKAAAAAMKSLGLKKLTKKQRERLRQENATRLSNAVLKFAKIVHGMKPSNSVLRPIVLHYLTESSKETSGAILSFVTNIIEKEGEVFKDLSATQLRDSFKRCVSLARNRAIDTNDKLITLLSKVFNKCYDCAASSTKSHLMMLLFPVLNRAVTLVEKMGRGARACLKKTFYRDPKLFWHFCMTNIPAFKRMLPYRMIHFLNEYSHMQPSLVYEDARVRKHVLSFVKFLFSKSSTEEWVRKHVTKEVLKTVVKLCKISPELKEYIKPEVVQFLQGFNESAAQNLHVHTRNLANELAKLHDLDDMVVKFLSNSERRRQATAAGIKYVRPLSKRKQRRLEFEARKAQESKEDAENKAPLDHQKTDESAIPSKKRKTTISS